MYWEYKLIRSVFCVQKCIYFKTKWMNRSIKVLSIAAYYFFPSLRQFSNSISKKWLVFGGDPILEPIFDFCERTGDLPNRAASFGTTSNNQKECPENGNGEYGKTSHSSVSKYFFTTLATWDRALSWRRTILSCLCSYPTVFLAMHGSKESIVADTDRP